MSIVKRRFFAGFMRSQERWLNSMADKGYRLVKTGKLEYTFDECEPGKYRYAVEYVGDKSMEDEEAYKAFLEDMGYTVFYKNINLDFSTAKLVYRPWANKGGRISTTGSTLFKELLIVEKENDGTEFRLHTEKEDRIEYYKRLSHPWYFAVFLCLALMVIYWPMVLPVVLFAGLTALFALPIIIMECRIHKIKKEKELEE
ncbi:MAG: DUF2812 domain-containing protein [Lachnospiraceae bacterium]|jgi:hypothetical protein|nr:DUF2812 domain-containing protein [Lachnospiraceae bacterium]MBO7634479.1 DUF2812 domain-containing protein [Lachnospiraceae bacterium]MBP5653594.1 DUF2812 domain-containing protein [Lachnospiraceae bacterium]